MLCQLWLTELFAQGERLERIWSKLKTAWNQFHSIMSGFINFECEEDSAFGRLSNETPAAVFLGFQNQDNECLKVLQALITLQVSVLPASNLLWLFTNASCLS